MHESDNGISRAVGQIAAQHILGRACKFTVWLVMRAFAAQQYLIEVWEVV